MLFNRGNHIIFAPTGSSNRGEDGASVMMDADEEEEGESDEAADSEEPTPPSTPMVWELEAIPQTPGIDHPVWQDHVSEADIGTMLSIQGQKPLEHWLHHTARFWEAFEMLTNQRWRECVFDEYTPR